jgi:hypothetical protein
MALIGPDDSENSGRSAEHFLLPFFSCIFHLGFFANSSRVRLRKNAWTCSGERL